MEPQNNSDTTPLSITPPEPTPSIEAPPAPAKIPSPSDPVVTSSELKSVTPAPESLTVTEEVTPPATSPATPETPADIPETVTPPTEPQLPPISPQVPPVVFNTAPTEPPLPPPTVSEASTPKKGSKLILIGIIVLIVFLAGYAYVTFSGILSK
jgi:hypothetical protein